MSIYRRILVAVDGSTSAAGALSQAIALATDQNATLRIAHVIDTVMLSAETLESLERFEESVRLAGRHVLSDAEGVALRAGLRAETVLLEIGQLREHIADRIARNALEWPADVIVLATHGRRGLTRLLMGSVAESLVRVATTTILLTRGR
jgi:nucleotide-binding universal stress UspA family protein